MEFQNIWVISGTISGIYIIWIASFIYGWFKLPPVEIMHQSTEKISVLVAIRNEGENLPVLLHSLLNQNFPRNQFELIIVDDNSEDNGLDIINKFQSSNTEIDITYFRLENTPLTRGKKAALRLAYQKAKYPIILMIDGDCEAQANWLQITANAYLDEKIKMVLGGVKITKANKLIEKFQSLELLSLIGSGAGAVGIQFPIMSNGANLSFKKEILKHINIKNLQQKEPSGDDIFLMMETKRIYGAQAIHFLKHPDHFVTTQAEENWTSFINQRLRWVSKSGNYRDPFLLSTSFVILTQNLLILVLLLSSIFIPVLILGLIIVWGTKSLIDYFLLRNICNTTSQKSLLYSYPLMAVIYPFFISYTAILGQFSSFSWKGRKY